MGVCRVRIEERWRSHGEGSYDGLLVNGVLMLVCGGCPDGWYLGGCDLVYVF